MSSSQAAYSIGRFGDPQAEVLRLERQAEILTAAEEDLLHFLGMPASGRLLDLGCGPGAVAARIGRRRPGLEVIGVDRDLAVLGAATSRIGAAAADAGHLPFSAETFDCVHARLILRHLARPAAVLQEVRRVLRPGGRAIIIDSDDGALVVDPFPAELACALRAKQETSRRRGGNPFMGRRLPRLLTDAGFSQVTIRPQVVDSLSVGQRLFAQIVLSPIGEAIDADLLAPADLDSARRAIRAWGEQPGGFGMTTVVAVGGTKD